MMTEEENYRVGQFSTHERNVGVMLVKRFRNGTWKIVVEVDVEAKLPDGRIVVGKERFAIGASVGHKRRKLTPAT